MAKKATRLNKDNEARKQIAIMRMGGVPLRKIAEKTGRCVKTITNEVGRKEHKELIKRYVSAISKKKLPVEKADTVVETLEEHINV